MANSLQLLWFQLWSFLSDIAWRANDMDSSSADISLQSSHYNHTSVMDDNTIVDGMILQRSIHDFPNTQNSCRKWACANSVYQALFPPAPTRAWERGYAIPSYTGANLECTTTTSLQTPTTIVTSLTFSNFWYFTLSSVAKIHAACSRVLTPCNVLYSPSYTMYT